MTKEEQDKLFDILAINGSIKKLYDKLAELEINKQKHSKEYKDTVDLIRVAVEITNKKFRTLNIEAKALRNFDEGICDIARVNDKDFTVAICDLEDNNKVRRTSMQIYYFCLVNHIHDFEYGYVSKEELDKMGIDTSAYLECDEDDFDDYDDYEDEEEKIYNDMMDKVSESQLDSLEVIDDFEYIKDKLNTNTFMDYLLEAIKVEKDPEIKAELIKAKYRFIYIYPVLESQFIKRPYNFTLTNLYLELYNFKIESVEKDIDNLVVNPEIYSSMEEIDYLSNLNEEDFQDKKKLASIILRSIYLRTYMSLNISERSKDKLESLKKELTYKSKKSKKYIEKAYKPKKEFSILKKVDI